LTPKRVARVCQHQLSFLFLLRDADMHRSYLLQHRGWVAVCHTPVLYQYR